MNEMFNKISIALQEGKGIKVDAYYREKIGADFYADDAARAADIAKQAILARRKEAGGLS